MKKIQLTTNLDTTETALLLDEKQAARYLGEGAVSLSFLRKSRSEGAPGNRTPGPVFVKLGKRVLYKVADLQAWVDGLETRRVV